MENKVNLALVGAFVLTLAVALVGVVLDELDRRGGRYGCISICGAAGVASAMVIERLV